MSGKREGEKELPFDPAELPADATLVFIGRIQSPWKDKQSCPKNMAAARETGMPAVIEIDAAYREGLDGLETVSHLAVLTWLDHSPRNLIVQKPRHTEVPRGVFSLRSPVRPNPIGLHVVRLLRLEPEAGLLHIEAIDVMDGTPVVDVKPYYASTDAVPDAVTGRRGST